MNPSLQMQSLFSNNSENLVLGQLGANSSFRFSGPPRGVLPIGSNVIRGLGTLPPQPLISTLEPSPLSDAETNPGILSYNYTLNHQGLASSIKCTQDTQSPIKFSKIPNNTYFWDAQGFCNETGLTDFMDMVIEDRMVRTMQAISDIPQLIPWACKSLPTGEQDPDYYIYLRSHQFGPGIADRNISCAVSPIQPAIFPVRYQSSSRVFSTQEPIATSAPALNFDFIEHAIWVLYLAVHLAQTPTVNLVAESAEALGSQAGRYEASGKYLLPLYEAMIQGILVGDVCTASNSSRPLLMVVPQLTHVRYLISTAEYRFYSPPPASCNRKVTGVLSAEVMGWVGKPVHIGFLMPMTIINLASFIIGLISMARAKRSCHEFDLTDPRSLVSAEPSLDENDHSGWADGVSYHSREVRECQI